MVADGMPQKAADDADAQTRAQMRWCMQVCSMLGTKKAGSRAVMEVGMTGGIRDGDGVSANRSRSQVPATLRCE